MTQSEEQPRVVVNDRRRVDPDTGEVRPPAADEAEASTGSGRHAAPEDAPASGTLDTEEVPAADVTEVPETSTAPAGEAVADDPAVALKAQLDERTADLQR
ncbi:nucleotide exchange factor GrpE, partial [Saccharothrix sp. MB29]|nr:nucleotide exchange factor GrpE [Saccharothrix sp. MB29]